jgi:CRISPR-associated DxTHG motif protein
MKILTFLGIAPAKDNLAYIMPDGQTHEAPFFGVALAQHYPGVSMRVFVTKKARETNFALFQQLTSQYGIELEPVDIADGQNEAELWKVFEAVIEQVCEGEEIIFDITHGFRSLPFLAFLAAAYLRTVKQVNLRAVFYGNFEASDRSVQPNRAPVIDLTPFVTLLDWMTGADQFIQTGDARRLATLLNPAKLERGHAAAAANSLSSVSLAAFLCQPFTLRNEARTLSQKFSAAEPMLANTTQPFRLIQQRIMDSFDKFGSGSENDQFATLQAQLEMVCWYYQNNQLVQAITLAREWLISAVTHRLGLNIDLKSEPRRTMEWAISGLGRIGREDTNRETGEKFIFAAEHLNEYGRTIFDTWDDKEQLTKLWEQLSTVRNALDHAEHQAGAMSLKKIVNKTHGEIMPKLMDLAGKWGFQGSLNP